MFDNVTLGKKLIVGFGLVTLIAGGIGIFGIVQMRRIDDADTFLYEKATVPLEHLIHIEGGFERAAANIAYCLYEQKTGDFLTIADDAMREANVNIERYRHTLIDAEDEELFNEMLVRWEAYEKYYDTLKDYVQAGKFDEGLAWRAADPTQTRRAYREIITKLVDLNIAYAGKSAADNTRTANQAITLILVAIASGILVAVVIGIWITRTITKGLGKITAVADSIAAGNLETPVDTSGRDEIGALAVSVETMQVALRNTSEENRQSDWLKTGIAQLNDAMRGDPDVATLASKVISEIATYLDAQVGALYVAGDEERPALSLLGSYA
nr:MCP four helix bundle domain-containing protein [PVC group bacterium]